MAEDFGWRGGRGGGGGHGGAVVKGGGGGEKWRSLEGKRNVVNTLISLALLNY